MRGRAGGFADGLTAAPGGSGARTSAGADPVTGLGDGERQSRASPPRRKTASEEAFPQTVALVHFCLAVDVSLRWSSETATGM